MPTDKIQGGLDLLKSAIKEYDPIAVVGLISGGHDSLTACHVAARHPGFTTCLHIDTGIGIPQTQDFVVDTCDRQGWPLQIYRATENRKADGTPDPMIWEDSVREHGFPGPAQHRVMYIKLKERPLAGFLRDTKKRAGVKRGNIILISGARSAESERRMGNVSANIDKRGGQVWVNIIHDWTKEDCNRYISEQALPRNPVVDKICKSGECLCGAFAKPGELVELAAEFPEVAKRIRELEDEVMPSFPWGWESRPAKYHIEAKAGQTFFDFFQPMCVDCNRMHQEDTEAPAVGGSFPATSPDAEEQPRKQPKNSPAGNREHEKHPAATK